MREDWKLSAAPAALATRRPVAADSASGQSAIRNPQFDSPLSTMPDDEQLALAHYALQFPTLASLGSGNPPSSWKAEYDRVAETGLGAQLVTSVSSEGTTTGAARNFDQKTLLWALHIRRYQLDPTYVSPFQPPPPIAAKRLGYVVRLDHVGIPGFPCG